jgi:hypothetical protein
VIGGQLTPLSQLTIPPNTSNRNFEIAILFDVVERFENYIFEGDIPPTALLDKGFKLCPWGI